MIYSQLDEDGKRKVWARWALAGNLAFMHVAIAYLLYAIVQLNRDTQTIRAAFDTVATAIGVGLLALVSDKLVTTFLNRRFGIPPVDYSKKTTITEEATTAPSAAAQPPGGNNAV